MRVAHIGKYLPPHKGGMESSILHLCNQLQTHKGVEIHLIGVSADSAAPTDQQQVDFQIHPLGHVGTVASTPLTFGLKAILKKINPDLIHVHLPNPWITGLLLSCSIPFLATHHCEIASYPWLRSLYSPLEQKFLSRAKRIIVTSPQLKDKSQSIQKFKNKLEMISLSVPPLAKKSNLSLRKPATVLFVGRLVPYKGLPYLIEAMRNVNAQLRIVGTGPELDRLKLLIAQNSLLERVTLVGAISDQKLAAEYQAADLVVLPSISEAEALGICLIEALSAGIPLLTTRLGTGVDFVNVHGETGLSVPPKNSTLLSSAMEKILSDPVLHLNYSQNALQRYNKIFSLEAIAEAHLNVYESVLNGSQP